MLAGAAAAGTTGAFTASLSLSFFLCACRATGLIPMIDKQIINKDFFIL
jgi:hypothetical protein